jgi:malonyl CoA-acyl carrier protein transacylase
MGAHLFDAFAGLTQRASEILGYSIKELCLKDPKRELNNTRYTQPALYVVNALSYLRKIEEAGGPPDYLAGHSLGEINALLAAGAFNFEDGLKIVNERAALMASASGGGMAAILNASKERVETILGENGLTETGFANFNTPTQIVISGPKEDIIKAEELFRKDGMECIPLNTSGAFHSRHMNGAKVKFEKYVRSLTFSKPNIPVISNVTARPYESERIAENLSRHLTHPVKWCESIVYLLEVAKSAGTTMRFEEIGHGNVLSRMIDKIRADHARPGDRAPSNRSPASTDGGAPDASRPAVEQAGGVASQAKDPHQKAKDWNTRHPIGTKVASAILEGKIVETRTEAVVLFGQRAAIYMQGFNGYFDLDEISPV